MIPAHTLIPGKRYRIQHIQGLLCGRTGLFIESYTYRSFIHPEYVHDYYDFNTTILSMGKMSINIKYCYDSKEWAFYESGETLMTEQVARGLCDRIPEDTAGIIYEFLIGSRASPGRSKFPKR